MFKKKINVYQLSSQSAKRHCNFHNRAPLPLKTPNVSERREPGACVWLELTQVSATRLEVALGIKSRSLRCVSSLGAASRYSCSVMTFSGGDERRQ